MTLSTIIPILCQEKQLNLESSTILHFLTNENSWNLNFCCNLSTQHTTAKNTPKSTGKLRYVDLLLWYDRKPQKGPILIGRDYPLKISINSLKQEMLYILTIVVREYMHVCICNLEQSNFDVHHDCLPKIRKSGYIWGFNHFVFWKKNIKNLFMLHNKRVYIKFLSSSSNL